MGGKKNGHGSKYTFSWTALVNREASLIMQSYVGQNLCHCVKIRKYIENEKYTFKL